jgi:hypothetical protein
VLSALILTAGAPSAQQATGQPVYQVSFQKTKPGRGADFTKKFEELVLPAYRELLKDGVIDGYYRYEVLMPGGAAAPYNLVSSVQFKNRTAWAQYEGKLGAVFQKKYPGRDVGAELNELRDTVRTVMFAREAEIGPPPAEGMKPVFVATLIRVHPGHAEAFRKLGEEVTLPVQKELLAKGVIEAYGRYPMVLPTGMGEEINMALLTRYKDTAAWAAAEGKLAEVSQMLFPNRNPGQEAAAHRDVVRTELVRLTHVLIKPTS